MPAIDVLDLDPRIAATGGYRRVPGDSKSNYEWPGMTPLPDWRRTRVHRFTIGYGCGKCGAQFASPNAVYTHLAKTHPRIGRGNGSPAKGYGLVRGDLDRSNGSGKGNGRNRSHGRR